MTEKLCLPVDDETSPILAKMLFRIVKKKRLKPAALQIAIAIIEKLPLKLLNMKHKYVEHSCHYMDEKGYDTLLTMACAMNHEDIIEALIGAKVNLNAQDSDGRTAVSYSCLNSAKMTALLIKHGADVNITSRRGKSPLMVVCSTINIRKTKILPQCAKLLIDAKADISISRPKKQGHGIRATYPNFTAIMYLAENILQRDYATEIVGYMNEIAALIIQAEPSCLDLVTYGGSDLLQLKPDWSELVKIAKQTSIAA